MPSLRTAVKVAPAGPVPKRATTAVRALPSIIRSMDDPALFSHPSLEPPFTGKSWDNWKIVLRAGDGIRMTAAETEFFKSIAGGREPPSVRVRECWWVVGRRGGKDSVASVVAAHTAATFNSPHLLRGGERALVICIASTREQARIMLRYIRAYFETVPMLAAMVEGEFKAEGFSLSNKVDIIVATNSFKGVRGHPILLAIFDEVAFYSSDEASAKPDSELYAAVEPGLSSLEPAGSRIIGMSTPYKKSGLLYQKYTDHFGKDDDDVLVIQAASRVMNSATISQAFVDRAIAKDPAKGDAEYNANFRDDIAGWLGRDILENSVDTGCTVRAPHSFHRYCAFVDPSGGVKDSFTMAVAHDYDGLAILDCIVEIVPPFSPMNAVTQIAGTLQEYGVNEVTGDHYAAGFYTSMFNAAGITYRNSDRNRSDIYQDCLPLFNSGRVRLLDNRRLVSQFAALERKTSTMGRDVINHPPGGHDDLCNSAAGALVAASAPDRRPKLYFS
jgi:hypothetical protein